MKANLFERAKRLLVPRSLRFQLLARSLFILAGLLLLIGGLQYVLTKDFLYRNQADTAQLQTRGLPRDLLERSGLLTREPSHTDGRIPSEPGRNRGPVVFLPDMSLAFIGSDGSFIDLAADNGMAAPKLSESDYDAIREKLKNREKVGYKVVTNDQGTEQILVFRTAERFGGTNGIIQMGTSTARLDAELRNQLLIFAGLALIALAGGLALYLPVLRRTLQPLTMMVKSMERIDAGNLDERFSVAQGQVEIDRLANSFNGMLERLESSFEAEREAKEQMRRFIADASHELRTPLTSIHGFLEVLLRGAAVSSDQLQAALASMLGESTRMKKLVEDLLTLAKLDRAPELLAAETRLDRLIREMEPNLRMLAGHRSLHFDLKSEIVARVDPDQIKQVVLNLFQNAVQHTDPESGAIGVSLASRGKWAVIAIRDNGTGIGEEHLPHLFERFYRSDFSRTRKHGGAGLGLAISHSIVHAHGGRIEVDSREGEGSEFSVFLPAGAGPGSSSW